VLPQEIGLCATRTEIDNDLAGAGGGPVVLCDTTVDDKDEDFTFGNTCTTWLLIDEY
jgi:hypothetical protein